MRAHFRQPSIPPSKSSTSLQVPDLSPTCQKRIRDHAWNDTELTTYKHASLKKRL